MILFHGRNIKSWVKKIDIETEAKHKLFFPS